MEQVILVNEKDQAIGTMEKMEAHRKGVLHRAFSVFIFDRHGKMLLQQRALHKYHSGGLWTNACCSHPRPGEETVLAASRRLKEELGFQTSLQPMFQFTYKAEFENGLTEYEFDHVFFGMYEGAVVQNEEEVMNFQFETVEKIAERITLEPENFTAWFRIAFPGVKRWYKNVWSSL
jgi:isopentenyl-diphosphate delta-isomerase